MTSSTKKRFWRLLSRLPPEIRAKVAATYRRWRDDPFHPGLQFKPMAGHPDVWSVRVNRDYRVVGRRVGNHMVWDYVGPHDGYEVRVR